MDTCLIVGLLPLIIILITASLSSNTYNKASWRADWTFEGTESMSFIASILPLPRKLLQLLIRNKIENNWPVTDYRRYSFILNRKQ